MNVLMPQLGETVTEGTISKWYKSVGDTVAAGEPLFEIETDKTSMEVPAVVGGILSEIRAQSGEVVSVGTVVGVVGAAGSAVTPATTSRAPAPAARATTAHARPPAPVATTASLRAAISPAGLTSASAGPIDPFRGVRTPERNYGKARMPSGTPVTPRARRLASQGSVDLSALRGSGPRGRIVAADVCAAAASGVFAPQSAAMPDAEQVKALYADTAYRELSIDSMRKTIARRLSESKQQVPHFYVSADCNVDDLVAFRKQLTKASGAKVSINDLVVRAYALALQKVTAANVAWAGDRLLQFERADVGVAVAVPGGLVTPIVRGAERKEILTIASELSDLIIRARDRRLQPSEYTGGSGTVSNLGMYGVRSFQAIVNPPQATILAVGAAERRPVVASDGTLRAAAVMTVTLSVDHRAIDGATAGELLAALRTVIENPQSVRL